MIIVDTNVIAELMRPSPDSAVMNWVLHHDQREFYTTAVTLAEVLYGIARLDEGRRKDLFTAAAEEVFATFEEHVLPFDRAAAVQYAAIVSAQDRAGLPISGFDAQIAAICLAQKATLATRNVKDFTGTGVEIIDPWHQD